VERIAVGFRVKSGWAMAALVAGPTTSPTLLDVRRVQLSDPSVPGSVQPYHAGLDPSKADGAETVAHLVEAVRRFGKKAVADLLKEYGTGRRRLIGAGVVVGSQVDPATIKNGHIRAHAEEGRMFRLVVVDSAETLGLQPTVIAEKNLFAEASKVLQRPVSALRKDLIVLGGNVTGSWRSEEKCAALAAWMALAP
jgi:hypothetical protein